MGIFRIYLKTSEVRVIFFPNFQESEKIGEHITSSALVLI